MQIILCGIVLRQDADSPCHVRSLLLNEMFYLLGVPELSLFTCYNANYHTP